MGLKKIVKGARIQKYPPGFHLYRTSRGIKRPVLQNMTEGEAQMVVKNFPLVYEKTISITDESGTVRNTINYRQYNKFEREESIEKARPEEERRD